MSSEKTVELCPRCRSDNVEPVGWGTEDQCLNCGLCFDRSEGLFGIEAPIGGLSE